MNEKSKKKSEKIRISEIFSLFEQNDPVPETELFYTNSFIFLIAVILSAQAKDVAVNKIMKASADIIDSPEKVVKLGKDNLMNIFKSLNLYKNKSKYIYEVSNILIEKYNSQIPLVFDDLIKLPGIGQKSANVILNVLADEKRIAVDTHVLRVSKRLGIAFAQTPNSVEEELYREVPKQYWARVNHWLVLHGRYVCKAKKPCCSSCFLNKVCIKKGLLEHTSDSPSTS